MKNFKTFINESPLWPVEMNKYKWRSELFLKKMAEKDKFVMTSGDKVIVKNSPENRKYITSGEYPKGFKVELEDGTKVSLSKFEKTKEFGGGSGSGGGTASTKITESAQCLYLSLSSNVINGTITADDCTSDNFEKAAKFIDVDASMSEMMSINQSWVETSISIANALYKKYKLSNVEFHRNSKFMNSIYSAMKTASKAETGKSIKDDKWNPGDIWIASNTGKSLNFPTDDLSELNAMILDNYISGDLIGVSLKKLSGKPRIEEYNVSEQDKKILKYTGYKLFSKRGKSFFKSIDAYINMSNAVIQIRAFNGTVSWQAEIKGKAAAGGKISYGPILDILDKYGLSRSMIKSNDATSFGRKPDDKNYQKFFELYKQYTRSKENINTLDEFKKHVEATKQPDSFRYSKYMSLSFVNIIESNKSKGKLILNDMLKYASSSSDFSSAFVKVY